jgi:hypothetical protein
MNVRTYAKTWSMEASSFVINWLLVRAGKNKRRNSSLQVALHAASQLVKTVGTYVAHMQHGFDHQNHLELGSYSYKAIADDCLEISVWVSRKG